MVTNILYFLFKKFKSCPKYQISLSPIVCATWSKSSRPVPWFSTLLSFLNVNNQISKIIKKKLKSFREFQIFGQSYNSDFKLKDLIFSIYFTCQVNRFTVRFTWSCWMPLIASARVGRLSYVLLPVFATWPVINREWFSSDRKFDIVSHIKFVELSKTWLKRFNEEENFDDSVRSSIRGPLTIE